MRELLAEARKLSANLYDEGYRDGAAAERQRIVMMLRLSDEAYWAAGKHTSPLEARAVCRALADLIDASGTDIALGTEGSDG